MTVKAYISRDPAGNPWPPVHEHEANGVIGLIQRLHEAVDHEPTLYTVFVNLQSPSADVAVLTELGLGVVELKHVFGSIRSSGGSWYAGNLPIKAGAAAQTPRQQAQKYAGRIRRDLAPRLAALWGSAPNVVMGELKVQTAVCFTNPQVELTTTAQDEIEREAGRDRQRWETFKLLLPGDFAQWVSTLRWGLQQDRAANFAPYRLKPGQIENLAQSFFKCDEWSEIRGMMPTGQPFGYLVLQEQGAPVQANPLRLIETTLGRDGAACTMVVPPLYTRVSRKHARLLRWGTQVIFEDLTSTHGSYVDGSRISGIVVLRPGQRITLGGPAAGAGVCELVWQRDLPGALQAERTGGDPTVRGA